jgi:hypothetical protein
MAVLRYHKPEADSRAEHPLRRLFMLRNLVVVGCAVIQMLSATTLVAAAAAEFGTAEEAKLCFG